jgi:hypothetical protein
MHRSRRWKLVRRRIGNNDADANTRRAVNTLARRDQMGVRWSGCVGRRARSSATDTRAHALPSVDRANTRCVDRANRLSRYFTTVRQQGKSGLYGVANSRCVINPVAIRIITVLPALRARARTKCSAVASRCLPFPGEPGADNARKGRQAFPVETPDGNGNGNGAPCCGSIMLAIDHGPKNCRLCRSASNDAYRPVVIGLLPRRGYSTSPVP